MAAAFRWNQHRLQNRFLLCWILLAPDAACGQVPDELSVPDTQATIELTQITELSFDEADVAPDILTRAFPLPEGGWGAFGDVFKGGILLFSDDGQAVGTLGSPGGGPGEFMNPAFAVSTDRYLWIVDPGNNRLTRYSPDLEQQQTRNLPGTSLSWAQPTRSSGDLLLSGFFGGPFTVGFVSMQPEDDRFGGNTGETSNPYLQMQFAAETQAGDVWAVAASGGTVDLLGGPDLHPIGSTRLPGDSLQIVAPPVLQLSLNEPQPPLVRGVMADTTGLLFIFVAVSDSDWQPGIDPRTDPNAHVDTLILAVDPARLSILSSRRMDQYCQAMASGLLSCVDELRQAITVYEASVSH